jgi:AcrR family transcriptional regulator
MTEMRGRAAQGQRTREAILKTAVDVASTEGLEGLTIGRLAAELEMSKSGLFAHFGSKEELQLATIGAAREIFVDEVVRPAFENDAGLPRLWALLDSWLQYAEAGIFKGGCFFAAASAEFDGRPGPVRDLVASTMREWLGALERGVAEAQTAGHVEATADAAQIAFELNSITMGANWAFQLYRDRDVFDRARTAMAARLAAVATPAARRILPDSGAAKGR